MIACAPATRRNGSQFLNQARQQRGRYLFGLRNGLLVECSLVEDRGRYQMLREVRHAEWANGRKTFRFRRGVEVHVDDIVFLADLS